MLGQKVASVESTNQFDVTSLSSGNYIVKIVGCAKGRSLNGVLSGFYRGLIGVTPLSPRQVAATSPFGQRTFL